MEPITVNPTTQNDGTLAYCVSQGDRTLGRVERIRMGSDYFWAAKVRRGRILDVKFFEDSNQDDAVKHVLRRAM